MNRLRTFQPSQEWIEAPNPSNFEAVMMPVMMEVQDVNQLFFLQRVFGQAPWLGLISKCILFPQPDLRSMVYSCLDGKNKEQSLVYAVPQNPSPSDCATLTTLRSYVSFSLLVRGLVAKTGRNEVMWIQTGPDTMVRQKSGPETQIRRFFRDHVLAEKELLFVIISFL